MFYEECRDEGEDKKGERRATLMTNVISRELVKVKNSDLHLIHIIRNNFLPPKRK